MEFWLGVVKNALGKSNCRVLESTVLRSELVNQRDFWHADTDSRNVKGGL